MIVNTIAAATTTPITTSGQRRCIGWRRLCQIDVGRGDDLVDHSLQAELLAILRREDPRDAIVVQCLDLGWHDDAAAATEHLDVAGAALAQQVEHVAEELDVPALIGRNRDGVRILLDRAVDDLFDRAVMAEVNDLATGRLQDAPHDVDRCVVAVEQARGRDEAHLGDRLVDQRLACGQIGHGRPRDRACSRSGSEPEAYRKGARHNPGPRACRADPSLAQTAGPARLGPAGLRSRTPRA